MKFPTLLTVILLSSISIFAQNKNADTAVQTFLKQFNERKFDEIYNSSSSVYQQKISNKNFQSYLNQIYDMAGKFKSSKFKSLVNGTYNYYLIAEDKEINADFTIMIDQDNRIEYLSFKRIGGSGNPPPISRIN
ncbi:MAG: DUF3887 domain-containing protein [Chryseobacterium sp.]|nr:MAG: DUF3887 domain-containing protein [Chryseobacterium sp.]